MSTYEAVKYNFNGSGLTNIVSIEVGTILPWSNSTLPSGYLNCDGSAVSRSTYAALFAIIASDYGNGDGSSTFNLPDLQDKVPLGVSGTKAVASSGGAAAVTPAGSITIGAITPAGSVSIDALTPAGNLTIGAITPSGNVGGSTGNTTISTSTMPSHSHVEPQLFEKNSNSGSIQNGIRANSQDFGFTNNYSTANTGGGGAHSHNMSANFSGSAVTPTGNFSGSAVTPAGSFSGSSVTPSGSFSGSSLSTLQPYVAIKFMIKV